jgi:cytidine deaminase
MAESFEILYEKAKSVLKPQRLSDDVESGGVGAALLSDSGAIYVGVCIDTSSSMGFCAERAAAAAMVTAGENRVMKMVAVDWDGRIMPPCGYCREFIRQLHKDNVDTEVLVDQDLVVTIRDLLPHYWKKDDKKDMS